MRLSRRSLLLSTVVLAASAGCTIHVETPRLTARDMRFTGVDGNGLTFTVTFAAHNSNTFNLDLRDINAHLWLDGNDVGSGVSAVSAHLPAQQEVPVTAQVTVPWNGAPAWLLAAAGSPTVNYVLRGDVTVQHYLSVRTSFETSGTVPRDFFMRGATGAINNVINSVLPGMGIQKGP